MTVHGVVGQGAGGGGVLVVAGVDGLMAGRAVRRMAEALMTLCLAETMPFLVWWTRYQASSKYQAVYYWREPSCEWCCKVADTLLVVIALEAGCRLCWPCWHCDGGVEGGGSLHSD